MSEKPYVYERQTEYWTSRAIEDYFFDAGYDIITFPVSQLTEKLIPADFIFLENSKLKIFGLQYKALYKNSEDFWKLDSQQHDQLQKFDWIYYCLSEMRSYDEHRLALHKSIIKRTNFKYVPKITARQAWTGGKRGYYRWSAFFDKFKACKLGKHIKSKDQIQSILQPNSDFNISWLARRNLIDIFLTDLNNKRVVHYSPFISINNQDEY